MISVSTAAREQLAALFSREGSAASAIRIAVMGAGSNGLGLIVDEIDPEADRLFQQDSVPIIVSHNLLAYCQSIDIDYREGSEGACTGKSSRGFVLTPKEPITF